MGQNHKMDLASDTCGLIEENFYQLYAYLAGGVLKALCVKQVLSYINILTQKVVTLGNSSITVTTLGKLQCVR